jgi:hypothetical protein
MRYRKLGAIQLMHGYPKEALDNFMTAKRLVRGRDVFEAIAIQRVRNRKPATRRDARELSGANVQGIG